MSDHIITAPDGAEFTITAPDGAEFTISELRESVTAYRSVLDSTLETYPQAVGAIALHDGVAGMALALLDEVERLTADEAVSA